MRYPMPRSRLPVDAPVPIGCFRSFKASIPQKKGISVSGQLKNSQVIYVFNDYDSFNMF